MTTLQPPLRKEMATNARHEVPRRQGPHPGRVSLCSGSALGLAVALTRISSRPGGRRIRVQLLRSEPVIAGYALLCSATVPCAPVTSQTSSVSPRRVAALDNAIEGPRQTCPGDPSIAHLSPLLAILGPFVESEARSSTLGNSGGACRRTETGKRAETLRNDLARAPLRAATHLSLLDR